MILCFLHAFLKIRDRAKRLTTVFPEVAQKVRDAYHQDSADAFIDKVTVLQLWAEHHRQQLSQAVLDVIHKLCRNAYQFSPAYDPCNARTAAVPAICSTAILTPLIATSIASGIFTGISLRQN